MLREDFMSVLQVQSRDELLGEVVRFIRQLGFETVTAMAVADHFGRDSEFASVDNTPAGFRELFENRDRSRRDPVMQHCKRAALPIIWNRDTYTSRGQGERWEEQAVHGYCVGIALALHLPNGQHFMLGIDRDRPLPLDRSEVSRMVADLYLFAIHAQDAALRVLLPLLNEADAPDLTQRELECLRWTMEGKTAWEVGRILGISEQTVVRHVNSATHKLGCVHKHHAVVKALRLGLIR
jgi:DNA-binding CsgD family transcriptional regulator